MLERKDHGYCGSVDLKNAECKLISNKTCAHKCRRGLMPSTIEPTHREKSCSLRHAISVTPNLLVVSVFAGLFTGREDPQLVCDHLIDGALINQRVADDDTQ